MVRKLKRRILMILCLTLIALWLMTPNEWKFAVASLAVVIPAGIYAVPRRRYRWPAWSGVVFAVLVSGAFVFLALPNIVPLTLAEQLALVGAVGMMTATGFAVYGRPRAGGEISSADLLEILNNPKVLNEHLFDAGLHTLPARRLGGLSKITAKSLMTTPQPQSPGAVSLLRVRNRRGRITRSGTQYLVPKLKEARISPVGVRAYFQVLPGFTVFSYLNAREVLRNSLGLEGGVRVTQTPLDVKKKQVQIEFVLGDPLEQKLNASVFIAAHPAMSPLLIPCAIDESGRVFSAPLHHTFGVGTTGSGKGSFLQIYVRQLARFKNEGLVKLYGADPKRAEFKGFEESSLFERVEFGFPEIAEMIADVRMELEERQKGSGRSFKLSRDNPVIAILIDEFPTLAMSSIYKKEIEENLNWIMAQGRSDGCYVIGAAQMAHKDVVGHIRQHFGMFYALRLASPHEVDMVLGDGTLAQGIEPHLITPANEANDYKTAGIGFARSDTSPLPIRIRFPYTSDEDILHLIGEFPPTPEGAAKALEQNSPKIPDDDLDDLDGIKLLT